MSVLTTLKSLLENPVVDDSVLDFYLASAGSLICELRNTDYVEPSLEHVQIKMAIELFNKAGAEGQTSHSENGVNRSYESGDISLGLLAQVIPHGKTPFSSKRDAQ